MPDSPTSERESDFVCGCEELMRSACEGEPFYQEHEGKQYCVLHFPGKEKSAEFESALQRKLENNDFNFRGVWFPDEVSFGGLDFSGKADFSFATFSADAGFHFAIFSAEADFRGASFRSEATFNGATFSADAMFNGATLSAAVGFRGVVFGGVANFSEAAFSLAAVFIDATFSAAVSFRGVVFGAVAYFHSATFSTYADFRHATFSVDAIFSSAIFSAEANFSFVTFCAGADFSHAVFRDYVGFSGDEKTQGFSRTSSLDLQFARIEKPEHVSLRNLTLRPHWFVNVADSSEFAFTNVDWDARGIKDEVASLRSKGISAPHRLLAMSYRRLALNARKNGHDYVASRFRYLAMDAVRRERWFGFTFWKLEWWYWASSGYGRKTMRAFMLLIFIWLFFAFLYTNVGFARLEPTVTSGIAQELKHDQKGEPLGLSRAITYSLAVMTLQKPEPKPITIAAQTIVLLETILGPLQAALFALAVRRKFYYDLSEE